ncbi:MAG: hypothetical protein ACFFC7_17965 [Candidatus Hermodarchaeota archaeon]
MTEKNYEILWITLLGGALGFFIGWIIYSLFVTLLNLQGIPISLYTFSEPLALILQIINYLPLIGDIFHVYAYPTQALIPFEGLFGSTIGSAIGGALIGLKEPLKDQIGVDIVRDDIMFVLGVIILIASFLFNILSDSLLVFTGFLIGEIFIFIFIGTQLVSFILDELEKRGILAKEETKGSMSSSSNSSSP